MTTITGFTQSELEIIKARETCREHIEAFADGNRKYKIYIDVSTMAAAMLVIGAGFIALQGVSGKRRTLLSVESKIITMLTGYIRIHGLSISSVMFIAAVWGFMLLTAGTLLWMLHMYIYVITPRKIKIPHQKSLRWKKLEQELEKLYAMHKLCTDLEKAAGKVNISDDKKTIIYIVPGERCHTDIRTIEQYNMTKEQKKHLLREENCISFSFYNSRLMDLIEKINNEAMEEEREGIL